MSDATGRRAMLRTVLAVALARNARPATAVAEDVPGGTLSEAIASLRAGAAVAVVGPGEARIRNPIVVHGLTGVLRFSPGARIVVTDPRAGGLRFVRCVGLTIEGLDLAWPSVPAVRTHFGAGLMFVLGRRLTVRDLRITGAVGAGLHVDTCTDVRVETARVSSTRADGIHFANCAEVVADDLATRDTGDDGVACVDYERAPAGGSHVLRGLRIEDSAARGIAIVGASGVDIADFEVRRTASSGLLIATDRHYRTRRPVGIRVGDGLIVDAGRRSPPVGNRFGIEAIEADALKLVRIRIEDAATRAVSIVRVGVGVRVDALRVDATRAGGGPAVEMRDLERISIGRMEVEASAAPALHVERCASMSATRIELTMTAANSVEPVAVFAGPGRIEVDGLRVSGSGAGPVSLDDALGGWVRIDPGTVVDAGSGAQARRVEPDTVVDHGGVELRTGRAAGDPAADDPAPAQAAGNR